MLELVVAADLVRQKTSESVATDVTTNRARTRDQRRRRVFRSRSAAALRGLAARIEPRTDPIAS